MAKKFTREEIESKVIQITEDECLVDKGEITPNARFVEDLGADSLDQVEIVMTLEETFDLEISDDEAEDLQTVQQAVDFIFERVGKK